MGHLKKLGGDAGDQPKMLAVVETLQKKMAAGDLSRDSLRETVQEGLVSMGKEELTKSDSHTHRCLCALCDQPAQALSKFLCSVLQVFNNIFQVSPGHVHVVVCGAAKHPLPLVCGMYS